MKAHKSAALNILCKAITETYSDFYIYLAILARKQNASSTARYFIKPIPIKNMILRFEQDCIYNRKESRHPSSYNNL